MKRAHRDKIIIIYRNDITMVVPCCLVYIVVVVCAHYKRHCVSEKCTRYVSKNCMLHL